jgi:hypothetical protein
MTLTTIAITPLFILLITTTVVSINETYAQWNILQLETDEEITDYCWTNFHNKTTNEPISQAICEDKMNTMRDVCSSDSIDPLLINNGTMKATAEGVELIPEEVEGMLAEGWTIVAPICNDPLRSYRINSFEIVEKEIVISEEAKDARELFDKYWK